MKKLPAVILSLLVVLPLARQAMASEELEILGQLMHKALQTVISDRAQAARPPAQVAPPPHGLSRLPAAVSPSQLYFPLNNGDSKSYRYSSYSGTITYTQSFFAGRSCYKEYDSADGSVVYFGHEPGRLVAYGFGLPGYGDFTLSNPLTIITDSVITSGGNVPQSSATLTFQGQRITVVLKISVSLKGQVVLPIGTATDCRSLDWTMDLIEPGFSQPSVTMEDAWVLAPRIGKVQVAAMAVNQFGIMHQIGWMDITSGRVNGVDVSTLLASPPTAAFSANPMRGPVPLTVYFTDNSSGTISDWQWNFGDGASSTARNPSHTYSSAGAHTVSLTVSGAGGSDTETKTNYIVAVTPAAAAFTAQPTSGVAPLSVSFTDLSSGDISNWSWSFGDGSGSSTRNPSHTYSTAGNYTVSLIVSGAGGSDIARKTDYVVVIPPAAADFSATPSSGIAPLTVAFHNRSTGAVASWSWSFGDGTASTAREPSHRYSTAGNYTVTLTATGTGGSSRRTVINCIRVAHQGADIDQDGHLTLADALTAMQVLSGQAKGPQSPGDIDYDGRIGLAEVQYILRHLALTPIIQ